MRKKQTAYPCRFLGCEWSARAPQPRGRHESQVHGMKGGILPVRDGIQDRINYEKLSMAMAQGQADAATARATADAGVRTRAQMDATFNLLFDKSEEAIAMAPFRLPYTAEPATDPVTPNGHMSPADHVRAALADMDAQRDALNSKFYALQDVLHLLDPADPKGEPGF